MFDDLLYKYGFAIVSKDNVVIEYENKNARYFLNYFPEKSFVCIWREHSDLSNDFIVHNFIVHTEKELEFLFEKSLLLSRIPSINSIFNATNN